MKKAGIIFGVIIFLAVVFLLIGFFDNKKERENNANNFPGGNNLETQDIPEPVPEQTETPLTWKAKGVAVSGKYADAEVIVLNDGKYRIYYSEEPEVSGFSGKLYSAISSDGVIWMQESGTRKEWATFPSIIKLSDGKYRMYFQNGGVIKSALSSDGLSWKDESGTRIDSSNNAGLNLNNVASPAVTKIGSEYVMVYRGDISGKYSSEVPNSNTELFLWATSNDGLVFEKKGVALDSRNNEFQGLLDGCEFVDWDGETRLYFWSYKGVYHSNFKDNKFEESEFDFSTNTNPNLKFYPDPPADPTLIKIGDNWLMYYGQHTKGIYFAEFGK
jgi:hypothetical protein